VVLSVGSVLPGAQEITLQTEDGLALGGRASTAPVSTCRIVVW
jgi:hypothetical protein